MAKTTKTKLQYPLTNDILFKMLFTKHQDLLKRLVAALLGIPHKSIKRFNVGNTEIPPEEIGKKFCRLDIKMVVNNEIVDLEIQVDNEGNYHDRSLYYWAREFSSALNKKQNYTELPRTIIISILGFILFPDYDGFHSEFGLLELTRHEVLTRKLAMHFFEILKVSSDANIDVSIIEELKLWLLLMKARTEEDLTKIEALEVPIMREAIGAYRNVAASNEFKELERMRSKRMHDEAQALYNAERKGEARAAQNIFALLEKGVTPAEAKKILGL
jgi:predicted transposase/invertase (TIGR01784 family)